MFMTIDKFNRVKSMKIDVVVAIAADIVIAVHLVQLSNASSLQSAYKQLQCAYVCLLCMYNPCVFLVGYDNLLLFLNRKIRNVIRA